MFANYFKYVSILFYFILFYFKHKTYTSTERQVELTYTSNENGAKLQCQRISIRTKIGVMLDMVPV